MSWPSTCYRQISMSVWMALTTVPLAKCVSTHWAPSAAVGKNAAAWAMNSGTTTPAMVSIWPSLEIQPFQSTPKIWFMHQATLLFYSRHQRVRSGHPQLRVRLCLQQHPWLFPLRPQRQVPGWLHPRQHRQLHWWAWCCPQVWSFFWLNGGQSYLKWHKPFIVLCCVPSQWHVFPHQI